MRRRIITRTPLTNAVLVAVSIISAALLTWKGTIPGDAFIALVSAVLGALLHDDGVASAHKVIQKAQMKNVDGEVP